jgi:acyl-CoA synthetase (AMP-forming)/AMP-acid ligase II
MGERKDLLKVGGENVDPAEVESFLLSHPAVA